MALTENEYQQMSLWDPTFFYSSRETELLKKSWAYEFAQNLFPKISEPRFSVLFSGKPSRVNVPINVLVGALIIKDLFDLSDEEMVENLVFDTRYKYALHTESLREQPLKNRSMEDFRRKCTIYEKRTGINLLAECFGELETEIALVRSMILKGNEKETGGEVMSHMRDFTNFEQLYYQVYALVTVMKKNGESFAEDTLLLAYDQAPQELIRTLNYSRTRELYGKLLADADRLSVVCSEEFDDLPEYQLLLHSLSNIEKNPPKKKAGKSGSAKKTSGKETTDKE